MKNKNLKITLLTFFFVSISHADSEKVKLNATSNCMGRHLESFQSLDDLRAAYGNETAENLFDIQEKLMRNNFIKCIRKKENKCAVKSLDEMIKKEKENISALEIGRIVKSCIQK